MRSVIIELFGIAMAQAGGELSSVARRSGEVYQSFFVVPLSVLAPLVTPDALKDIDEWEQREPER